MKFGFVKGDSSRLRHAHEIRLQMHMGDLETNYNMAVRYLNMIMISHRIEVRILFITQISSSCSLLKYID